MKKTVLFSSLFLFVFGLAVGITVLFADNAQAYSQCAFECLTYTYCSNDQGPLCPENWYYRYSSAKCGGGPLNCPYFRDVFVGCCKKIIEIPIDGPIEHP